eukprot:2551848-Amphidinium_carterae.2
MSSRTAFRLTAAESHSLAVLPTMPINQRRLVSGWMAAYSSMTTRAEREFCIPRPFRSFRTNKRQKPL